MLDRSASRQLNSNSDLCAALRALPLAAPELDAWPELAKRLKTAGASPAQVNRWRYALPLALAAAIALFTVAPGLRETVPMPVEGGVRTAAVVAGEPPAKTTSHELATLHAQSQSLEQWLRDMRSVAAPFNGQDLMAAAEIEDLIGLVDVQLQAPGVKRNESSLWRQRVALLQDLAALRYSQFSVAGNHVSRSETLPTATATWIN